LLIGRSRINPTSAGELERGSRLRMRVWLPPPRPPPPPGGRGPPPRSPRRLPRPPPPDPFSQPRRLRRGCATPAFAVLSPPRPPRAGSRGPGRPALPAPRLAPALDQPRAGAHRGGGPVGEVVDQRRFRGHALLHQQTLEHGAPHVAVGLLDLRHQSALEAR